MPSPMSLFRRLAARLEPVLQSDTEFIKTAYRDILGRAPDADGLEHYLRVLRDGMSRTAVLLSLMRSPGISPSLPFPSPSLV